MFFLLLTVVTAVSQPVRPIADKIRPEIIYNDIYGNIYTIEDFQLTKFDTAGRFLHSFGDFKLGHIASADVSNPQKIMLFYRDAGVILFLDEHLAPIIEPLDLFAAGFRTIEAAAYSTSNNIWLYNKSNHDLIKTDFQLNRKDIIHLNLQDINTLQMFEIAEKTLVMNAGEDGIYFFDPFGTLVKHLSLQCDGQIQIIGGKIFYLKENTLHEYDTKILDEKVYNIGLENIKQALINKNSITLLTEKGELLIGKTSETLSVTKEENK